MTVEVLAEVVVEVLEVKVEEKNVVEEVRK